MARTKPTKARRLRLVPALLLLFLASACGGADEPLRDATASASPSRIATPATGPTETSGPRGFHFAVVGDFGSADDPETSISTAMKNWVDLNGADALITTGDNIYPSGSLEDFQEDWIDPYAWVATRGLPVMASLGNHDEMDDGGQAVMDLLGMPGRWYSRSFGDAELFVLDANDPGNPDQLDWLHGALSASTAPWKIVVFHQPAYSCASHDGTPQIQELWVPLFEQAGVDLVLNGHDHDYQRFASVGPTTYIVTGGGGSGLYPLEACPAGYPARVAGDDQHHHFVTVREEGGRVRVQAITDTGTVLDDFTLAPAESPSP